MFESDLSWGLGALSLGLGTGTWFAIKKLGGQAAEMEHEAAIDDLEEHALHLVAQLRDLEQQREHIEIAIYESQKREIEKKAAEALRQREQLLKRSAMTNSAPNETNKMTPTVGFLARNPQLKGALWGGGVVAVAATLWLSVNQAQQPRADAAMTQAPQMGGQSGEGAQGGMPNDAVHAQAQNPEIRVLRDKLSQTPNDVDAMVQLAHHLLRTSAIDEVQSLTKRALELDPKNGEAKVHAAVLRGAQGDGDGALADLTSVLKENPKLAEGWLFRGMLGMQSGLADITQESFKQFVAVAPDGPQKERIKSFLDGGGLQMPHNQ